MMMNALATSKAKVLDDSDTDGEEEGAVRVVTARTPEQIGLLKMFEFKAHAAQVHPASGHVHVMYADPEGKGKELIDAFDRGDVTGNLKDFARLTKWAYRYVADFGASARGGSREKRGGANYPYKGC